MVKVGTWVTLAGWGTWRNTAFTADQIRAQKQKDAQTN